MNNVYLGDGLYADFDGYQVRLYATNYVEQVSEVFLDSDVLTKFLKYIDELKKEHKK